MFSMSRRQLWLDRSAAMFARQLTLFSGLTLIVLSALLLIPASPAQAQTETVLYNFAGSPDGAAPNCRLTPDGAGNLYGTTQDGGLGYGDGNPGYGTVFELSPNGKGGWNEKLLYSSPEGRTERIHLRRMWFSTALEIFTEQRMEAAQMDSELYSNLVLRARTGRKPYSTLSVGRTVPVQ